MAYPNITLVEPGWAMPKNAPPDEPTHWWRPDGHQACDSKSGLSYVGRKAHPETLDPLTLCLKCVEIVEQAEVVLGSQIASR